MSIRPACEYQPACPGCPRFGSAELDPQGMAALVEVARLFGLEEVGEHPAAGLGHRHRSRLSVRGSAGALQLGIFEAGSHRLVPIVRCPVHHPSIASFLPELLQWLNEARIEGYDEIAHRGLLRAVQLAVEPNTQKLQLVLLVCDELDAPEGLMQRMRPIWERWRERLSGLFLAALPQKNNSLVATRYVRIAGDEMMHDVCGGEDVYYPPDAFGQANPQQHARVVEQIHRWVSPQDEIVEYYAGVGTIGLGLLAQGHRVIFNEIGGGSLRGLGRALREHPRAEHALVIEGKAGDAAHHYSTQATVIVDPPRKGLDPALLRRLLEQPPERLIYLSCGLDAFVREAQQLAQSGRWRLTHLSGWAYFPFTHHIETLALFERGGDDGP